jgi:hypothetical protein
MMDRAAVSAGDALLLIGISHDVHPNADSGAWV